MKKGQKKVIINKNIKLVSVRKIKQITNKKIKLVIVRKIKMIKKKGMTNLVVKYSFVDGKSSVQF